MVHVRQDALRKAAAGLVAKNKPSDQRPTVIEDLNVSGMLKNRHLSRAIADVGLYEFHRLIEYKAKCRSLYPVSVTTYVTCTGCCCGRWIDTSMVQSPYMLKASSWLKTAIYVELSPRVVSRTVPISMTAMLVVISTCASVTGFPLLAISDTITVLAVFKRAGSTSNLIERFPTCFVCLFCEAVGVEPAGAA